jgi:hypothetical protein
MADKITVGIVQASPVFMNLETSLAKAVALIEQAANKGAKLVAFGETWLAGYPAWLDFCPSAALWNHEPTKEVFAKLRRNSVVVPGAETRTLAEIAAKHGIVLIIGINERIEQGAGNGTLYNSLLTFGADGTLLNHHRKLVPTYTERLVWGTGRRDWTRSRQNELRARRLSCLLGTLDAAGASGNAQLRRAYPRRGFPDRSRNASDCQPSLRARRQMFRSRGWFADEAADLPEQLLSERICRNCPKTFFAAELHHRAGRQIRNGAGFR